MQDSKITSKSITGEAIKRARHDCELTQEELGKKIDVAAITIRQYESGKRSPSIEQIRKLAFALAVPIGDLLDDEYKQSIKKSGEQIAEALKKADEQFKEAWEAFLNSVEIWSVGETYDFVMTLSNATYKEKEMIFEYAKFLKTQREKEPSEDTPE